MLKPIYSEIVFFLLQSKLDLAVGEKVTDTDKLLDLSKSVIHYSVKTGKYEKWYVTIKCVFNLIYIDIYVSYTPYAKY